MEATKLERAEAKLGVELEGPTFTLYGASETAAPLLEVLYKTKGNTLHFFVSPKDQPATGVLSKETISKLEIENHWRPTAEVQQSLKSIQVEIIYGGKYGTPFPTAATDLPVAGKGMADLLKAVNQGGTGEGASCYTIPENIKAIINANASLSNAKWKLRAPASELGIQFTAPLPLAVVNEALERKVLFDLRERQNMLSVHLEKVSQFLNPANFFDGLQWREDRGVSKEYGRASIEGFLVPICSYIKTALPAPEDQDRDLKKQTPLMPRTDFAGMLTILAEMMQPVSANAFKTKLPEIVSAALKSIDSIDHIKLEGYYFSWGKPEEKADPPTSGGSPSTPRSGGEAPPPPPPPPGGDPPNKGTKKPTGPITLSPWNLELKTWIQTLSQGRVDLVAEKDKQFRGGQIGGLGNKVETLIGTLDVGKGFACPIVEFRGPGSCKIQDLEATPANFLQKLEAEIRELHKLALGKTGGKK